MVLVLVLVLVDFVVEYEFFSYIVFYDLCVLLCVVEGFVCIFKEDYGVCLDWVGNDYFDCVMSVVVCMNSMIDVLLLFS